VGSDCLNVLSSLANPFPKRLLTQGLFCLRLTCVIDGDFGLDVTAPTRPASPTNFSVINKIDCRDHFKKQVIDPSSVFFGTTPLTAGATAQVASRDDTPAAQSYANAVRASNELAQTSGSITIPRFTTLYTVGSRISGIFGRTATFQANAASAQGEAPEYPAVVSVHWTFGDKQTTTLMLNDRRAEPQNL
jgi:hypothetical protein